MTKFPSSTGKVPKAKGGSNRTLDHGGVGKMPKGVDNTRGMSGTAPAGGKGHPSLGPGGKHESYKNAPKDFPTLGDNPPTTRASKW